MAEGRTSMDPADEATPQPPQQETWACRKQAQENPCPPPACPSTQARRAEGCGTPVMPPGQVLATGRMLAQRLQDALVQLQAQVGQLPALLQQAAQRAQRRMAEVHGAFSRAGSLRELLETVVTQGRGVVAQGRGVVAQAWEALVMFLLQHLLLPWLEDAAETTSAVAPRTTPPHPQT